MILSCKLMRNFDLGMVNLFGSKNVWENKVYWMILVLLNSVLYKVILNFWFL